MLQTDENILQFWPNNKREAWENLYNLKIAQLKIFHALNNLITGKF